MITAKVQYLHAFDTNKPTMINGTIQIVNKTVSCTKYSILTEHIIYNT